MNEPSSRSEESRYNLGLLFTDGLPDLDDTSGYRGAIAARAAGISYRQLDYWARTQLVEPVHTMLRLLSLKLNAISATSGA